MLENINEIFGYLVGILAPILFMEFNGFPLIVLVLLIGLKHLLCTSNL